MESEGWHGQAAFSPFAHGSRPMTEEWPGFKGRAKDPGRRRHRSAMGAFTTTRCLLAEPGTRLGAALSRTRKPAIAIAYHGGAIATLLFPTPVSNPLAGIALVRCSAWPSKKPMPADPPRWCR